MSWYALAALVLYLALAFGLRSWLSWRRTGTTGYRGISGRIGSAEWLGGVLFVVALLALIAAPTLDLLGILPTASVDQVRMVQIAGWVLVACGALGTLWSQFAMGDAWRIGVDPTEQTELVLRGPFRLVRNPIFSSMVVAVGGFALLVPGVMALTALTALIAALQLQVRRVEEPHLLGTHGVVYRRYAARVGRFVPGVGRLVDRR